MASAFIDLCPYIKSESSEYAYLLSDGLSDVQEKIDSTSKLSEKAKLELFSLLSDLIFTIFSIIKCDLRISEKITKKLEMPETGEERNILIQIAELYETVLTSNHSETTDEKTKYLILITKVLCLKCGRKILKTSFTDKIMSLQGK